MFNPNLCQSSRVTFVVVALAKYRRFCETLELNVPDGNIALQLFSALNTYLPIQPPIDEF
jgi:hypothetical protein